MCFTCGEWLIRGTESPREVGAWVPFLYRFWSRRVCQHVSCLGLGFAVCCMARFRDHPQWSCQGNRCTQNFMWRAACRLCGREVPHGLKKKQLETLVEKDERTSRKMRYGRGDRGRGSGGSATHGGGVDPRDAEVRAVRKQLAELQRKTSAPVANVASSSSPSDSERSECTATIAELARMLTDLESMMGASHPASLLLRTQLEEAKTERDGAQPLLEKIQTAEKRFRARQKSVEVSAAKRDQLQLSLQASP